MKKAHRRDKRKKKKKRRVSDRSRSRSPSRKRKRPPLGSSDTVDAHDEDHDVTAPTFKDIEANRFVIELANCKLIAENFVFACYASYRDNLFFLLDRRRSV